MARTNQIGIKYFSFDVDFFNDEKIEFTSARFGVKGEVIAIRLLCKIYRNGYYTPWNDDESALLAKRAGDGVSPSLVSEVVKELVKRGFFDETLLNRFGILTSRGIQKRYFEATKRFKSVEVERDFLLVEVDKIGNVNINSNNADINSESENNNSQKKRKEIKEKEITSEDKSSCHLDGDEPPSDPRISYTEFIEGFNKICTRLPKVQMITEKRRGFINARLKEHGRERIFEMFQKANLSDFLAGQTGDWMADFDWLMRPNNFVKVLEGKYNNKTNGTSTLKASDPRRSAVEGYNVPL
jgi:hypothetical protein